MNIRGMTILAFLGVLLATLTLAARVGAMGLLAPPPNNTLPGEQLTGPGVIRRDMSGQPALANARMEVLQGERGEDGSCHLQVSFSAPKGDTRAQMAREVALDPATCRFQVERGFPISLPTLPAPLATTEVSGGK